MLPRKAGYIHLIRKTSRGDVHQVVAGKKPGHFPSVDVILIIRCDNYRRAAIAITRQFAAQFTVRDGFRTFSGSTDTMTEIVLRLVAQHNGVLPRSKKRAEKQPEKMATVLLDDVQCEFDMVNVIMDDTFWLEIEAADSCEYDECA